MTGDIREITQVDFDNMVSGQKNFFRSLIENGRARIVPASNGSDTKRRPEKNQERRPGPLDRLEGKRVIIRFNDGATLEGSLTEVGQFEIILFTDKGALTILKHAITMVSEVS